MHSKNITIAGDPSVAFLLPDIRTTGNLSYVFAHRISIAGEPFVSLSACYSCIWGHCVLIFMWYSY